MKKMILALVMVAAATCFTEASAQQMKFYYYPNSNVYYDVAGNQYIYSNNGNWSMVKTLPSGIRVVNTPRYLVYNSTPQVWIHNPDHIKKYKYYKGNGKHKGWSKTQPRVKAKPKM